MQKTLLTIALTSPLSFLLIGCGNDSQEMVNGQEGDTENTTVLTTMDHPLEAEFRLVENNFVVLNISEPYTEYWDEHVGGPMTTEEKTVRIEWTDDLLIQNLEGDTVELENVEENDIVYLDYDIAQIVEQKEEIIDVDMIFIE
ncbi:hypothetical protein FLK61_36485 [Paenalkalicoccus suaedae]|uniref:Uncharacterized protein n=1 Tax=Paenalkalicoccus suaedae TaxID=2592382 RepID=A0A859FGD1_9BACI|nr:hypothetical protein [Paenalkalicoccus suaedae]QKS72157.1 hypothetical protein FLK61_36485 [Paenalkalicoccus suaedae]